MVVCRYVAACVVVLPVSTLRRGPSKTAYEARAARVSRLRSLDQRRLRSPLFGPLPPFRLPPFLFRGRLPVLSVILEKSCEFLGQFVTQKYFAVCPLPLSGRFPAGRHLQP